MDVGGVSDSVVSMVQGQASDDVGVAVLKKALDIQAQNAATLINAIPKLPDHLGQNINTTA